MLRTFLVRWPEGAYDVLPAEFETTTTELSDLDARQAGRRP